MSSVSRSGSSASIPMRSVARGLLFVAGTVAGAAGCSDRRADAPDTSRTAAVLRDSGKDSTARESESLGIRDYRAVAEKVVGQVAGVQAGDVVWLLGRDEDLPLLEDLAVEVQKRGGSPLMTVRTERLRRRMYDEVPAQYDTVPPEANLRLAGVVEPRGRPGTGPDAQARRPVGLVGHRAVSERRARRAARRLAAGSR